MYSNDIDRREARLRTKREHYHRNAEKIKEYTVSNRRKLDYGITSEQYDEIFINQNGVCAICGGPPVGNRKSLSVDHDHTTGKIRGLLCNKCNSALGMIGDSPLHAKALMEYLIKYEARGVDYSTPLWENVLSA